MAKRLYEFKTGVLDFLGEQGATSNLASPATTIHDWGFVTREGTAGATYTYPTGELTYVNVRNAFLTTYSGNPFLNNDQVKAIGYGWQKWVVPHNMDAEIMIRGASGGHSAPLTSVFNQNTGLYTTGVGYRGGRGAKLTGKIRLLRGEILYILVGIRGWCNGGPDWGGMGGGASVILRDNPLGVYTFAPLNKKVDVLMVAGGGGGAYEKPIENTNTARFGKDAVVTNGVNTNGGILLSLASGEGDSITAMPVPGAGLTGNGITKDLKYVTTNNNLLSGLPVITTSSRHSQYQPTGVWGGGGAAWNGGGGGGGYSGGDTNDPNGGNGGTSYINPAFVTETFRGYETDISKNPYSIPGSVQISGGRDDSEWFLAQDAEGFKRWEESQHKWVLMPNQVPPTAIDFEMYGVANPIGGFAGLIEGDVKILCSSPYQTKALSINGYANKQLVKCNFEMSLIQIDVFKSWNLNNLHPSVTIKTAVSVDHGLTYKILISNIWTNIDINNKDLFYAQGILLQDLNTIPNVKWKELGATNLRFAFIVHQNANYSNPVLTSVELVADLLGSWRKAIHGANYDYEYIAPDTCKITISTAGDYKINYLDAVDDG